MATADATAVRVARRAVRAGRPVGFAGVANSGALDIDRSDIVLPALGVGLGDERLDDHRRIAGVGADDAGDARRADQIRQAIAADEQGGVGLDVDFVDLHEVGIVRGVPFGPDIAVDLVAARMAHGLRLGDLVSVLALADRRVIARHLLEPPAAQLVQTRIADVPDGRAAVADHRGGQHAGHPFPLGPGAGEGVDLVVRDGNGFAQPGGDRTGFAFEPGPQHRQRDIGRLPAGRLAADAVDHEEQATRGIAVKPILVDFAPAADVSGAGGVEGGCAGMACVSHWWPPPRRSTPPRGPAPPAARIARRAATCVSALD